MRVVVSTLNVHGDLRQETLVGVYTLPLVASNTPCHVDAPLDVRGNLVSIECTSSYGDMVRLRVCTRPEWLEWGGLPAHAHKVPRVGWDARTPAQSGAGLT